jgi:hypothetical protein
MKIGENKGFQKQLWSNLRNSDFNLDKVLKMDYSKEDLTEYFIEYNTLNDASLKIIIAQNLEGA